MQRLEVSGAVRPIYGSLGVKRLSSNGIMGQVDQFSDRHSYFTTKHGCLFPYTFKLINQSQIFPPLDAELCRESEKKLLNHHRSRINSSAIS